MKAVQFSRHGVPGEVVEVIDTPDPGAPAGDELLVKVLASAINPADLLILEGRYPGPETLPAGCGIEGCGDVIAVGAEAKTLAVGDRVMIMGRENWAELVKAPEAGFIKLPAGFDPLKGAQMKANPMSALLMLTDYVELKPGDWVIQNAANSAVGRHVIRLAKSMGAKTINVVRRASLIEELSAEGADLVIVDGDDLAQRVRAELGQDAPILLALDAIAGKACERLCDCLSDGGTAVNYGRALHGHALSHRDPRYPPARFLAGRVLPPGRDRKAQGQLRQARQAIPRRRP